MTQRVRIDLDDVSPVVQEQPPKPRRRARRSSDLDDASAVVREQPPKPAKSVIRSSDLNDVSPVVQEQPPKPPKRVKRSNKKTAQCEPVTELDTDLPTEAEGPDHDPVPASVIAPDLNVTGEVLSDGRIEIYGTVEGKVNSKNLTVGEGAHVRGAITADQVRIRGSIEGPITANSVVMDRTAWVEGSIFHHKLSAHPESVHHGRKPWRLKPLEEGSE